MQRTSRVSKIDNEAVNGLLGVNNSLAYKVHEIEKHMHNYEFWFGDAGSSTMTRAANTTMWTLTSGAQNVYGIEVQLASANDFNDDTEGKLTAVKIDLHKMSVGVSEVNDKTYIVQFWCGESTFAAADYLTEVPYRTGGNAAESQPIDIICPRFGVGCKIWARVKCEDATANRDLDMIIGMHGYVG